MKIQIKNLVASALFGAAVLGAVALQSFDKLQAEKTWYFNSSDTNEIDNPAAWTQSNPAIPGCSPLATQLPCELKTPAYVDDQVELQAYFDEMFDNTSEITAAASSRRNVGP